MRPLLAVAPGARWSTKRWPVERFAAVAQTLAQAQQAAVVVLGSAEDSPLAQELCQRLRVPVLNSTGKLSLMHTAALLQQCHLLLSNDSGLMHMATAPTGASGRHFWTHRARIWILSFQGLCPGGEHRTRLPPV